MSRSASQRTQATLVSNAKGKVLVILQEVLVMLESKKVQPRENEGQVLAQMSAVKDVRVGEKRKRNEQCKRNEQGHDKVRTASR